MSTTYDSATAIADIAGATYDDLKARFAELATVIDLVSAERKTLCDEICRREADLAARMRLGALTDDDKRVYRGLLDSPGFSRM